MNEKQGKDAPGQAGEPDDLDKMIASLPSLRIPSDMIEDNAFVKHRPQKKKTEVTTVFALISWGLLLFGLLTLARAYPSHYAFFQAYAGGAARPSFVDQQYILNAMIYLACNTVVCAGGLAICALRKKRMFGGSALSFWITGGVSAIIAAVLFITQ
jgi:hypothetical protein